MSQLALFGTSADPPTCGHQALLEGLLGLYPAVATWASTNPLKRHGAPLEERAQLLGCLVEAIGNPRLEFAQATEAKRAIVTIAPASDDHAFKDFFELYRQRLDALGGLLANYGISLGLALAPEAEARAEKAHQFIHTYEGLIGLVSVCHPSVGVVVDAWALHLTGEPLSVIGSIPAGRIVEVRLSDAPRDVVSAELSHAQRLMPAETGVIPAAQILVEAQKAGFDGPVTPWADRSTLAGRGREKIVRLAGDRLEAVWKEAGLPIVPRWFAPSARENAPRFGEDPAMLAAAGALDGKPGPVA